MLLIVLIILRKYRQDINKHHSHQNLELFLKNAEKYKTIRLGKRKNIKNSSRQKENWHKKR